MPTAGVINGCSGRASLSVALPLTPAVLLTAAIGGATAVGVVPWSLPADVGVEAEVNNEDVSSVAELLALESEEVGDTVADERSLDDPSELCAVLVDGVEDGVLPVEVATSVESCRLRCLCLPRAPFAQQSATASCVKTRPKRMAPVQRPPSFNPSSNGQDR